MNGLDYQSLPRRTIVKSNQRGYGVKGKKITTYGIMAKIKGDNMWLMIRNRHSAALTYILHGGYQPVHITELLEKMSMGELNFIKVILNCGTIDKFKEGYKSTFGTYPLSEYAFVRMMDLKKEIISFDGTNLPSKPPFSFPKGKRNPKEDTIITATREFYEETGVKETGKIDVTPIIYEKCGLAGRQYTIKCWVSVYDDIIPLEGIPIIDKEEILEKAWVYFDPSKYDNAIIKENGLPKGIINGKEVDVDYEVLMLCKQVR